MKILYDCQAFDIQSHGGVSNIFAMLVNEVRKTEEVSIAMAATKNTYMLDLGYPSIDVATENLKKTGMLPQDVDPRRVNWTEVNKFCLKNALEKNAFDVFHPTHYDPYFLEYGNRKPYVVTVHDLAFERLRDYIQFNKSDCFRDFGYRNTITRDAKRVVAISEATKKDLIEIYNVPENKIDVVYNAYRELPENYEYEKVFDFPYILYVGTRMGPLNYKCFIPFFTQIVPFMKVHKDFKLVCTGYPFSDFERDLFRQYGLEDRVIHKYASESELNSLYHYAFCFVFPSEFEGFGLPILEAYKNDCPALLNDIPVFHEVGGDKAMYFDVTDGKSLNEKLESLYSADGNDIKDFVAGQRERLPLFTTEKMAEGYIKVYNNALE